MNHLPLIRKSLCKKTSLHNAELFLSSRPSHSSSTELNIRLLKQKSKRKAIETYKNVNPRWADDIESMSRFRGSFINKQHAEVFKADTILF